MPPPSGDDTIEDFNPMIHLRLSEDAEFNFETNEEARPEREFLDAEILIEPEQIWFQTEPTCIEMTQSLSMALD